MSYRETEVEPEDGGPWVHFGASNARVERTPLARWLSTGSPVVVMNVTNQLVTPDELRALADYIDRRYGRRSASDTDVGSFGGTD